MRCMECSGLIVLKRGDLRFHDDVIGDYIVSNVEYFQCEDCNEHLYPAETLKKIEEKEANTKEKLLLERPLREFIQASEVAEILDCTRQAVHKNKRIQRGFVHWIRHKGVIFYLKKSVYMFKKTGDGRLPLNLQVTNKWRASQIIVVRRRSKNDLKESFTLDSSTKRTHSFSTI